MNWYFLKQQVSLLAKNVLNSEVKNKFAQASVVLLHYSFSVYKNSVILYAKSGVGPVCK